MQTYSEAERQAYTEMTRRYKDSKTERHKAVDR